METLSSKAIALLQQLIQTPSFSGEEGQTADRIAQWFKSHDIPCNRMDHTVWATNKTFHPSKPTLLLNSHHDTVKPNQAYTKNPFDATIESGKLYGLGSNDAGGALVALIALFTHYYAHPNPKYNLLLVASAEEESAGPKSLRGILPDLPKIDVAIVGEPTLMELAIAEKGLIVFDGIVKGTASHAAHPNTDNPILKLPEVLTWFKNFQFKKESPQLGPVKMTVSQVNAGTQHNVVPSEVHLVVDVRVNECYTNAEVAEILKTQAPCQLKERSLRLNASSIPLEHELVQAGIALGKSTYGSPTLSDQAALSCPSLKLGPGDSTRSHTADEFIYIKEIEDGITFYMQLLKQIL